MEEEGAEDEDGIDDDAYAAMSSRVCLVRTSAGVEPALFFSRNLPVPKALEAGAGLLQDFALLPVYRIDDIDRMRARARQKKSAGQFLSWVPGASQPVSNIS